MGYPTPNGKPAHPDTTKKWQRVEAVPKRSWAFLNTARPAQHQQQSIPYLPATAQEHSISAAATRSTRPVGISVRRPPIKHRPENQKSNRACGVKWEVSYSTYIHSNR